MNKFLIVILLLVVLTLQSDKKPTDSIKVVTESNFKADKDSHEFFLVEFYAPWCGHCKRLTPIFESAANKLKLFKSPVLLGKADVTVEKEFGTQFDIKGYPTVKLFQKDKDPIDYTGRNEIDIVKYCLNLTNITVIHLETQSELQAFRDDSDTVLVYFGSESDDEYKIYKDIAASNKYFYFGGVFSKSLTEDSKNKQKSVVIYKKNSDPVVLTEKLNTENINLFIQDNAFPNVIDFNQIVVDMIWKQHKTAMITLSDNSEDDKKFQETLKQIATDKKGKLIFTLANKETEGGMKQLADYLGVKVDKTPQIVIVGQKDARSEFKKFLYSGSFDKSSVEKFIDDYFDNKLKQHYKSESPPEKNDETVKVAVSSTFNKLVIDNTKDVIVTFQAAWCGHCKSFKPKFEEAAEAMKNNPNIQFVTVNSADNDIEGQTITGYPTIKFFINGKKDKPMSVGMLDSEGLIEFLKENTSHSWETPKEIVKKETKEDKKDVDL